MSELTPKVVRVAKTAASLLNLNTTTDLSPIGINFQVGPGLKRAGAASTAMLAADLACGFPVPGAVPAVDIQGTVDASIRGTQAAAAVTASPDALSEAGKKAASGLTGGEPITLEVDATAAVPSPTTTNMPAPAATEIPATGTSTAAVASETPKASATPAHVAVETASPTPTLRTPETPTVMPTPAEIERYTQYLESLGITVNLPREGWPVTPEQAAEALKATDPAHAIKPEQLTPIIETLPDGKRVWNGWMMGEPAFPMKENIFYDANLHVHIDRNTNQPEFDPQKIFKNFDDLSTAEKADFKNHLVDIKINQDGVAVYANKGGIVRDGDPDKNTKFFFGTPGSEVMGTEQITLIPVSEELCVADPELSGATKSFRQAAIEFRDNEDARTGKAKVEWFNPETGKFETLDGRLVAQLAKQGVDISYLERSPANTPLSPEDMAKRWGGKAENWILEPKTGEWFYEAYKYQSGVHYVNGVGPVNASGKVLVGMEQANSGTSKVFNFNKLDTTALVQDMNAPGSFQATLFARQGTMGDSATKNHSWYTWGNGSIHLQKPGIEQMTFMPHNPAMCLPSDMPNELAARARTLAVEQPDKNVTAFFWDGVEFMEVIK